MVPRKATIPRLSKSLQNIEEPAPFDVPDGQLAAAIYPPARAHRGGRNVAEVSGYVS